MSGTGSLAAKREHWRQIVAERQESGLSIVAFCRLRGVDKKAYYYWCRRVKTAGKKNVVAEREENVFIPVRVESTPKRPEGSPRGQLEINMACGRVIAMPLSAENLRMTIAVLEGGSC